MEQYIIDKSRSPEYLTDVTVEYCRQKKHIGFFTDLSSSNVTKGFMIDSKAIEGEGGLHALARFDDSPHTSIARAHEERDRRAQALAERMMPFWTDPIIRAKVIALMDRELKLAGWDPKVLITMEFVEKGRHIAELRWKNERVLSSNHRDIQKSLRTHEFHVYLRTLHYGYANIVDNTVLVFPYDTTFHNFLWVLQHQTVLCTIPPRDLMPTGQGRSVSRESSRTLSAEEEPVSLETTTFLATQKPCDHSNFTERAIKSQDGGGKEGQEMSETPIVMSQPASPSIHTPEERGYTLNAGAWRYRITTSPGAPFIDISNEEDFKDMVKTLKDQAENESKSDPVKVIVMHSMDRRAWTIYREKEKALEMEDLIRQRNSDTAETDEWFDKHGESFLEWFPRYQSKRDGDPAKKPLVKPTVKSVERPAERPLENDPKETVGQDSQRLLRSSTKRPT